MITPGTSSSASGWRELGRIHELRGGRLAFALEHAVDRSLGMLEQVAGHERGAVAAHEDEGLRTQRPRGPCQVDQLGNVRQIVAGECHNIGSPLVDLPEEVGMTLHLEIEQANLVPGTPQFGGDEFDSQRLQPQEDLRVQERAGMNGQYFHGESQAVVCISRASGQ